MPNARLGSDRYQFCMPLLWLVGRGMAPMTACPQWKPASTLTNSAILWRQWGGDSRDQLITCRYHLSGDSGQVCRRVCGNCCQVPPPLSGAECRTNKSTHRNPQCLTNKPTNLRQRDRYICWLLGFYILPTSKVGNIRTAINLWECIRMVTL